MKYLTKSFNYAIIKIEKAGKIGSTYILDSSLHNLFYLRCNKKNEEEPKLIRDYFDFLKNEIPDEDIMVLQYRNSNTKITGN